jgi:hypothetical protein
MDEGQGRGEVKIDWEFTSAVDFKKLEESALRRARTDRARAKNQNLANAYGMGPRDFDTIETCEKCGYGLPFGTYTHDKRSCMYLQAMGRQADQGYVPVPPLFLKILKTTGIVLNSDLLRIRGIPDKQGEVGPYQRGVYAPVWAVLSLHQANLGSLTSTKRLRVQAAILELQRLQGDVADQKMLAGEHFLQKGAYTRACRALVAKASE